MHDQLTLRGTSGTPVQAAPALPVPYDHPRSVPAAAPSAPIREWTGRDAVALRKALRMTEAKFARAVGVSARTVANWHTYPVMVPRNDAQDHLDELFTSASAAVLERFARFGGHPHAPDQSASSSDPAVSPTLLKELVRERHLTYEAFSAEYEKAAAGLTADTEAPSRATYWRWLSGHLKGRTPYPGACRVLEAMFAPWRAADLFGPYQPGSHGPGDLERALSTWAVSKWLVARQPALSPGPRKGDGGRVVSMGSHPRYRADFRALASGQVAEARAALGLTLPEFAALLKEAVGWNVMPETVGRWETESAPPGDVVLFAQAYLAGAR
jgi:DNA-binding transcriptional regulator YiaG